MKNIAPSRYLSLIAVFVLLFVIEFSYVSRYSLIIQKILDWDTAYIAPTWFRQQNYVTASFERHFELGLWSRISRLWRHKDVKSVVVCNDVIIRWCVIRNQIGAIYHHVRENSNFPTRIRFSEQLYRLNRLKLQPVNPYPDRRVNRLKK